MVAELTGGTLIGLAAGLLWLGHGRISGMTGVISSLFLLARPGQERRYWSLWFFLGLILAWPVLVIIGFEADAIVITDSPLLLIAAGLLVGIGTYIGNGCTSGHGVCGIGRLSVRSMVATLIFMTAGILTVALMSALNLFMEGGAL
tara:strand:+ start:554 stop:991 length:438 start_codon:yes stop_codon:yes gene_type:complete